MAKTDSTMEYANRLLENDYVQDKLREAGGKLRAAKQRASRRRVDTATDEKLRRQVRDAALALSEAASAFRADRTKPKPGWGRRLAVLAGVGVAGAAVALAASDDLRTALFGNDETPSHESDTSRPRQASERTPAAA